MSDATGTTDWSYDTLGDVVLVEGPLYPGSGGIASRWDRNSNRRLLTYTDGAVRRFDHDQAGRTVEIALAGTGGTWWPDATMSYDAVGRLLEENVLSGGEVARRTAAYNTAGKMTTYTQCWDIVADACDDETDPATAAVYDAAIGWRHDGRVGSVCVDADDEDACSGGDDYVYDAAGQLRGSGPGCELVSGAPDGDCKETWSYDGQGHRVDHDPDTTVGSDTATYSYDDSGRLTTAVVGGSATTSYSYDAAGRRTSVDRPGTSSDETFGYNPMGRLDQWTRNSTAIATLHSDGQGTLSAITQGPLTFPLIWDTTGVVPGLVQVAPIRATWADHAISSDNSQWYGYDWLDNTNQTATSNTNPGVTLAYDPYGGIDNPQPTYLAFGFGMRASLTIGGYVHLQDRTYDPETGTFFTPDPLDTVTGTPTVGNAYHYTDNDPLNKVDPLGLRACDGDFSEDPAIDEWSGVMTLRGAPDDGGPSCSGWYEKLDERLFRNKRGKKMKGSNYDGGEHGIVSRYFEFFDGMGLRWLIQEMNGLNSEFQRHLDAYEQSKRAVKNALEGLRRLKCPVTSVEELTLLLAGDHWADKEPPTAQEVVEDAFESDDDWWDLPDPGDYVEPFIIVVGGIAIIIHTSEEELIGA